MVQLLLHTPDASSANHSKALSFLLYVVRVRDLTRDKKMLKMPKHASCTATAAQYHSDNTFVAHLYTRQMPHNFNGGAAVITLCVLNNEFPNK